MVQSARVQRRFTLLDAMTLVAATAIVLGAWRWYDFIKFYANLFTIISSYWSPKSQTLVALGQTGELIPFILWTPQLFLASWTIALFGMRLVSPRPRWRRLTVQPGAIACGVASLVLVVQFHLCSFGFSLGLRTSAFYLPPDLYWRAATRASSPESFVHMVPIVAWSVAASWLILAVGGRWRPASDWIDRAGRVLGVAWMAMIPFYVYPTDKRWVGFSFW